MSESRVVITAQADQAIREFDRLRAQATGSLRQIGELGGKLDSIHSTMGNIIKASIAGVSIDWLVGMVKGSIDTLDNLKDLSATTKISVEDLSGLKLAATQSGAELEGTAEVISKLTVNMGKNSEKFARLGVTSKEPLEAFKQFADVFAAVEDPALRAALAADAVGKSWKSAAPLMSEGGQRIGEMVDKGKAMSGVTAEMAARADDFNDQMAEMSARIDGAKMSLAIEMLPTLNEFTKRIVDAYNESGKLHAVLVALETMGGFMFSDEFDEPKEKIKNLREELEGLRSDLASSKNVPFAGGLTRWLFGDSKVELEAKIAGAEAQIQYHQDQIDGPAKEAAAKAAAAADKKAADEKAKAAAAAAAKAAEFLKLSQANEKASADAALAQRKAMIEADMAARARGLAVMAEMNRQGLASDAAYYVAKREAALAAGTDAVRIKDAEIAALRSMGAKDAAEQAAINGKIAVLNNQKNAALQASLGAADLLRKQYLYDAQAPVRAAQAAADGEVDAVNKEVVALQAQYENYGKLPAAITAATIAKLQARAVALETNEGTEQEIANTNRLIAALQTKAQWEGKVELQDKGSDLVRANQLLEVMTALDDVARDAASGMEASFGRVGAAIGGMTTALTGYGRAQAAIAANLAQEKTDAKGDVIKIKAAEVKASQAAATAQIRQYSDMATAAKGFFKENSTGYKVMESTEKAFRAYEMGLAVKNMLAKSGLVEMFTSLFVTSKAAETAATVATVAPDVAASLTKGKAAALTAVAKQGSTGDGYSAWVRMAAMAAAMAALGFAVSSGNNSGGGVSAADAQAKQGTGSVFGNGSAKSDSIARAIELSAANSNIELTYTAGMLNALVAIRDSMDGLNNLIVRSTGVTDGSNLGVQTGQLNIGKPTDMISTVATGVTKALLGPGLGDKIASFVNNLWGKTSQNIVDSGLQFGGSVNDLQAGRGYSQYASVDTTKSSWFGLSKKTTNSVQTQGLSDELSAQFGMIFTNLESALKVGAESVGMGADYVSNALDRLTISKTQLSLKGLTGDDLTAAINGVISKTMDEMAEAVFPSMDQFRKVGEGYAETVVRITTNYANLDATLDSIGMRFGATGLASLAAREDLIQVAGGIDSLAGKAASFSENFLTEQERLAPLQKYVTDQMSKLGLAYIDTREEFKNHVLALKPVNEAERQQFAALMDLEGAFAKVTAQTKDLSRSAQEIADERADLQAEWDELTMTSAQLQAKACLAIDPSNQALFDQVALQRQLKEATGSTSDALKETIDRLTATKTSTLAYLDSLALGSLSTLTPMQKYLETQRQYNAAVDKALANPADSAAASGAQSAATAFLTASQVINASSAAFIGDKSKVQGDMGRLAAIAGAQMTDAQRQLSALDKQVVSLDQLNGTAAAIQQAIVNQGVAAPAVAPAFDLQRYAASSSAGTEALASEVKALRADNAEIKKVNEAVLAELKLLRTDAKRNTDDIVDATEGVGDSVAKEVGGAMEQATHLAMNPSKVAPR